MNYDISFLSSYTLSSKSSWENSKIGSPLDGSNDKERFSFHTLVEDSPFIIVELPFQIVVNNVEIVFRDKYKNNSLPIVLKFGSQAENFIYEVDVVNPEERVVVFAPSQSVTYIKIQSKGYQSLDFSAIKINVDFNDFLNLSRVEGERSHTSISYGHASFYGLGGKLSVLATLLGFVEKNNNQSVSYCDQTLRTLVEYPFPFKYGENIKIDKKIDMYASESLKKYLIGKEYRCEKNISHYLPFQNNFSERSRFCFISRNNIEFFQNKCEHFYETHQRLYKRIIPSKMVLDVFKLLRKKHSIVSGAKVVGVHFRHGNGELYCSKKSKDYNVWGVKPPKIDDYFEMLDSILEKESSITDIVISSDCPSVVHCFDEKYGAELNVHNLSQNTQPTGAGCNHVNRTFGNRKRNPVDLIFDDK